MKNFRIENVEVKSLETDEYYVFLTVPMCDRAHVMNED